MADPGLPRRKQLEPFQLCVTNQNLATLDKPGMRAEPVTILLDADSEFRAMPVLCEQSLKGECTAEARGSWHHSRCYLYGPSEAFHCDSSMSRPSCPGTKLLDALGAQSNSADSQRYKGLQQQSSIFGRSPKKRSELPH
jgi:hypothetical protein